MQAASDKSESKISEVLTFIRKDSKIIESLGDGGLVLFTFKVSMFMLPTP